MLSPVDVNLTINGHHNEPVDARRTDVELVTLSGRIGNNVSLANMK